MQDRPGLGAAQHAAAANPAAFAISSDQRRNVHGAHAGSSSPARAPSTLRFGWSTKDPLVFPKDAESGAARQRAAAGSGFTGACLSGFYLPHILSLRLDQKEGHQMNKPCKDKRLIDV